MRHRNPGGVSTTQRRRVVVLPVECIVVGISHHTAPVELRERLAVEGEQLARELRRIVELTQLKECVLISTCNRVEVVAVTSDTEATFDAVVSYLDSRIAPDRVEPYIDQWRGEQAIRHLFRVASGLEAMVLGEPQILGQVKQAFAHAQALGTVGTLLNRGFERAFTVAKRVRTETDIAAGQVSVSSIACQLAEKIFGDLAERRILLVGAGEMSELAASTMQAHGARLYIVNRSVEHGQKLAQRFNATPRPFESLANEIKEADVVISSTANPGFVITVELMQSVIKQRKRRPLFFIDIAVPRDVDPRIDSLDNVFLYNIDDLDKVAATNLDLRKREIQAAEVIIDEAVDLFEKWKNALELTPTIVALKNFFSKVVLEEKEKTLSKLPSLSAEDQRRLDAMCDAIVNKLLHKPFAELKRSGANGSEKHLIEATQRLFQLAIAGLVDQQAKPSIGNNDDTGVRKGMNETSNSD